MGGNAWRLGISDTRSRAAVPSSAWRARDRWRRRGHREAPPGARRRSRGVHPLRAEPRPNQERFCPGCPEHRLGVRGRRPRFSRGPTRPAIRRASRAVVGPHGRRDGLRPRRRLHLQRGQVPPTRQSHAATHRSASVRTLPGPANRAGPTQSHRRAGPLRSGQPRRRTSRRKMARNLGRVARHSRDAHVSSSVLVAEPAI